MAHPKRWEDVAFARHADGTHSWIYSFLSAAVDRVEAIEVHGIGRFACIDDAWRDAINFKLRQIALRATEGLNAIERLAVR
jgi:hypothetical protein